MSNKAIVLTIHPGAKLVAPSDHDPTYNEFTIIVPSATPSDGWSAHRVVGRGKTAKRAWANASVDKSIPKDTQPGHQGVGDAKR